MVFHRLFLDANVLFSAAYRLNAGLAQFWKLSDITLCSSRYAVEEARINLSETSQRRRLDLLTSKLELIDALAAVWPAEVRIPEKDRPIVLAAIEARATHLITGDLRHFGPYFDKKLHGIFVMTPSAYFKLVGFS